MCLGTNQDRACERFGGDLSTLGFSLPSAKTLDLILFRGSVVSVLDAVRLCEELFLTGMHSSVLPFWPSKGAATVDQ